ncbi:MAG: amidinotransferase [Cyclobacteriaceae bacterium]|nr:amidinotransferase [Cyclobacteriaceae bacterium]
MKQSTRHILMIRPVGSSFNPETALSNPFQQITSWDPSLALRRTQEEFDSFVAALRAKGVEVEVVEDTLVPGKPDAVFPNNWVSFHEDGTVILYPMMAPSRRRERRVDVIERLRKKFVVREVIDLSRHEKDGKYLEGTGSIVFDHVNQVAYACGSPRTDKDLFFQLCQLLKYRPVYFHAYDEQGKEIYHTNVMMCVGVDFAIVCLASITDLADKKNVIDNLRDTDHAIIEITMDQLHHFAGNMLVLDTQDGPSLLVASRQAVDSLTQEQKQSLSSYAELTALPISTIEMLGGGSARCMMAEIFLPKR